MATTKKYKLENFDRIERDYHIHACVLQYALRGEVRWLEQTPIVDGRKYRLGVAAPERADGGFLILRFICSATKQTDTFQVSYFEEGVQRLMADIRHSNDETTRQLAYAAERIRAKVYARLREAA